MSFCWSLLQNFFQILFHVPKTVLDGFADRFNADTFTFGDSGHVKSHEIIGVDPLGLLVGQRSNRRGFTQEQLSDVSGHSVRHIANIEKGDVNPSFEVLYALVKVLGVSFDSIFDPAGEQLEAEIQEITGLYRSCPEQGRRLIWASICAMANELMNHDEVQ